MFVSSFSSCLLFSQGIVSILYKFYSPRDLRVQVRSLSMNQFSACICWQSLMIPGNDRGQTSTGPVLVKIFCFFAFLDFQVYPGSLQLQSAFL